MQASSIFSNMKDRSVEMDFATTEFSRPLFLAIFATILARAFDVLLFFFAIFRPILGVFGPRDPENRVRRAILRRLVVGELRRMIFKRFYAKLRDGVGHQKTLAPTIAVLVADFIAVVLVGVVVR